MDSAQTRRVVAAGMIGNVLEWYDFAIYGYFAASIGRHFFPHEDPVAQLLAAFGVAGADRWRTYAAELAARYEPSADPAADLRHAVELLRKKYGAEWVGDWYLDAGRIPVKLRLGV